eukprot:312670_1
MSQSTRLLETIDAAIIFLGKSNNFITDQTGIIIEEIQQNCLLIHNVLNMHEQMELFEALNNKKYIPPTLSKKVALEFEVFFDASNMQTDLKEMIFGAIYNKSSDMIDRNYKTQNLSTEIELKQHRLLSVRGIKYDAPNGNISKHIDGLKGLVYLYSIGCTANFYVNGPQMNDGIIFKFKSGDMLFFDASQEAAITHAVISIDDESCPLVLGQKCDTLKHCRVSCQIRAY